MVSNKVIRKIIKILTFYYFSLLIIPLHAISWSDIGQNLNRTLYQTALSMEFFIEIKYTSKKGFFIKEFFFIPKINANDSLQNKILKQLTYNTGAQIYHRIKNDNSILKNLKEQTKKIQKEIQYLYTLNEDLKIKIQKEQQLFQQQELEQITEIEKMKIKIAKHYKAN